MAKLEYTFKYDTLFKMLFTQYPELLKHLVAELLGIRFESIGQFMITNPDFVLVVFGQAEKVFRGMFPLAFCSGTCREKSFGAQRCRRMS